MPLFTKKYYQNYGSNGMPTTRVELTDANCAFVHSLFGVDTNTGARDNPVKTITKGLSLKSYVCCIGVFTENIAVASGKYLFSDSDVRILLNGNIINASMLNGLISDFICNSLSTNNQSIPNLIVNSLIGTITSGSMGNPMYKFQFNTINSLTVAGSGTSTQNIGGRQTIINVSFNPTMGTPVYTNHIFINEVNLQSIVVNYRFSYCLFRKSTIFKFKGTIIPITYNGDSTSYMDDLRNSINAYANTLADGTDKTWLLNFAINGFVKTESGLDTCVIHDDILGVKIFNRYSNNIPVDYTLNVHPDNPALTMGSDGLHVGAYKPTISAFTYESIQDIDSNGSPTANTANMLVVSGKVITVDNTYDTQFWNRATSGIVTLSRGLSFDGLLSDYRSGITKGFYFGKKQVLSITNSPRETVEIIPYNDATTPSTFPNFSASLNGTTKIFHLASDNSPLLYNQLSTYGYTSDVDLAIYGNYAVTDADSIIYQNIEADLRFVKRDINVRYCKIELNLHYSA